MDYTRMTKTELISELRKARRRGRAEAKTAPGRVGGVRRDGGFDQWNVLAEMTHEGLAVFDTRGTILLVNRSLCRMLGWSRKKLVGSTASQLLGPDGWHTLRRASPARGETMAKPMELALVRKGGTELHVLALPRKMYDSEDRSKGTFVVFTDVTGQKRMEEQLLQKTSELTSVFRALPDLFFRISPDGVILDYKAGDASDLYVSPKQFLGKSFADVLPPDVARRLGDAVRDVVRTQQMAAVEYALPMPAGQEFFEARILPLMKDQIVIVVRNTTERTSAEHELILEKVRFQQLFENTRMGIVMLDEHDRILQLNPAFETMFQYSNEEARGKKVNDLIAPPSLRDEAEALSVGAYRAEPVHRETVRRRKDGSLVQVRVYGIPIRHRGNIIGIYGMYEDISERKAAEERLRESEEMFRVISENAVDLIAVLDLNGNRLYNSPSYKALLGDPEELRGGPSFNEIHPDDREEIRRVFTETVHSGVGRRAEYRFLARDGGIRYIESQGSVVKDEHGKPQKVVVVSRDITERRQADQQIQLLAQTVAATKDCFCVSDTDNRVLFVNGALVDTFGYSEEELIGTDMEKLYTGSTSRAVLDEMGRATRAGGWNGEVVGRRKDASEVPIELWTSIVRNDDGEPVAVVGVGRDITERKRSELVQTATYRISEAAQSARGFNDALSKIHAIISEIIPAKNFYIALYDSDAHTLSFPYFVDEYDSQPAPKRPGKGLTEYVLRTGQPLLADPSKFEKLVALGEVESIGAPSIDWLGVPLKVKDALIGALVVQSYSEGVRFSANDVDILMFVSTQVAMAIERIRNREDLRESEMRFRAIFERAGIGMALSDTEGSLLQTNRALQDMLGYSAEELTRMSIADITHPDDFGAEQGEMRKTLTSRRVDNVYRTEKRYIRKDGRIVVGRLTSSFIWDSNAQPLFGIGMVEDITEQKRAEEQSYQSRQMLQLVLDNIPQRVFWKDRNFRYLGCNRPFARDAGLDDPASAVGKDDFQLSWKETAPIYRADDTLVMQQNVRKFNYEEPQNRPDGSLLWLRTSKAPLLDQGGNVIGVLGTYEDITERRLAEEKIKQQATLLDVAHDAISVRDLNGTILFWNKGAERLFGWKSEEVIGQQVDGLLRADLGEASQKVTEKGEWNGELRQTARDGREVIVQSRWTLVRDDAGLPKSVLVVNTDITEKKLLEAQFQHAQRMEIMGTLAGGIAHDLNNVLSPILMSIEMLQENMTDERRKRLLNTVETSAKRGADIVKQVLTFARGMKGERVILQPKHLVKEVEKITHETFPKSIDIRSDLPKDLWAITGDATQLHQVLMNLCVNARDAMVLGGVLKLGAENAHLDEDAARIQLGAQPGDYVVLSVEDTGTGIPEEVMNKIFDPFFTTKEVGKGTGLGLPTVLGIVQSHNGFITVNSTVGEGTRFRVYLPAAAAGAQGAGGDLVEELPPGHGEVVLVVDDEESIREISKETLEAYGYKVLLAADGKEAIVLFDRHRETVDVVLTDLMMPNMDGTTLIHILRRIDPTVKVIVASGLADGEGVPENLKTSIHGSLPKPYRAEQLLKILRSALE